MKARTNNLERGFDSPKSYSGKFAVKINVSHGQMPKKGCSTMAVKSLYRVVSEDPKTGGRSTHPAGARTSVIDVTRMLVKDLGMKVVDVEQWNSNLNKYEKDASAMEEVNSLYKQGNGVSGNPQTVLKARSHSEQTLALSKALKKNPDEVSMDDVLDHLRDAIELFIALGVEKGTLEEIVNVAYSE